MYVSLKQISQILCIIFIVVLPVSCLDWFYMDKEEVCYFEVKNMTNDSIAVACWAHATTRLLPSSISDSVFFYAAIGMTSVGVATEMASQEKRLIPIPEPHYSFDLSGWGIDTLYVGFFGNKDDIEKYVVSRDDSLLIRKIVFVQDSFKVDEYIHRIVFTGRP